MITLQEFINNKNHLSKKLGVNINVDSVFIQKGNLIEKHFFTEERLHEMRSISKVLVAMAMGIAIDKKLNIGGKPITLNTRVYPIIKNLVTISNNNVSKIDKWTIKDLLTHATGYEKQMMSEKYIEDIDKSNVLEYALNYYIPYDVGTRYEYNNVEPFVISVLFQEAFSINLSEFVNKYIFEKLKITEYRWDNYGKYCIGATGLYLRHSDFHKIAQLLLFDGKYEGEQIISEKWIKEMCTTQIESISAYKPERVLPKIGGGYFTSISRDGFVFKDGSVGQYLILNKGKNFLMTIMSTEPDMKNVSEILRGLI